MAVFQTTLLFSILLSVSGQEYYVTPTSPLDPNCPPGESCHTLSYYANNASYLLSGRENVSLIFLEGVHNANSMSLNISNFTQLSIIGPESFNFSNPSVKIQRLYTFISDGSSVVLGNVGLHLTVINVTNVTDVSCDQIALQNVEISVLAALVNSASLNRAQLSTSSWLVFWGYEERFHPSSAADANDRVVGFTLADNILPSITISDVFSDSGSVVLIALAPWNDSAEVKIDSCGFIGSYGFVFKVNQCSDGQLSVAIEMQNCYWYQSISGTFLQSFNTNVSLLMDRCFLTRTNFGLQVYNSHSSINVSIANSHFIDVLNTNESSHGILYVGYLPRVQPQFLLENVTVMGNFIAYGVIVMIGPVNITISNCFFKDNEAFLTGVFRLVNANLIFKGNNTFLNNTGSSGGAIHMSRDSSLVLEKDSVTTFIGNTAFFGGAIFVGQLSNTEILDDILKSSSPRCFYQLPDDIADTSFPQVYMSNNTAYYAENHIFGAALQDRCTVTSNRNFRSYNVFQKIFSFTSLSYSSVSSSPTRVCLCEDNKPQCANTDYIYITRNVTPGEVFELSVLVVGYDFGAVPGSVFANFDLMDLSPNDFTFGDGEEVQQLSTGTECSLLTYSILTNSTNSTASFFLSTSSIQATIQGFSGFSFRKDEVRSSIQTYKDSSYIRANLLYLPIDVTVNMFSCPEGFELNQNKCTCDSDLENFTTQCFVRNGETVLKRMGTNWIGTMRGGEYDGRLLLFHLCSTKHCIHNETKVNFSDPQSGCVDNHYGILCGGCKPGYSLALGSSRCIECQDSRGLSLLIAFLALGVAHICFIRLFNYTVSKGLMTGLVFYTNMVWINQEIFFPNAGQTAESNEHLFRWFLTMRQFVALWNLDFGWHTCFIQGLDAYQKAWLQFLYPSYLFALAFAIIVASQYSTKFTKVFGKNSVSVLSTIFLFGYVKLVRTVFSAFSFARVKVHKSNDVIIVWLLDGNVAYFETLHLILFLFSLAVAIVLCFLTICLLFVQHLHKFPLRIIHRLNPFFDSIVGSLKDKHRYWTGLSLTVRFFVAGMAVHLQATSKEAILAVLCILTACLGAWSLQVYKNIYHSLTEFVFILNVLIVSVSFLATTSQRLQVILISISVFVSFCFCFAGTVYHCRPFLKKLYSALKRCLHSVRKKNVSADQDEQTGSQVQRPSHPTMSIVEMSQVDDVSPVVEPQDFQFPPKKIVDFSQLREELLEDNF